MSTPVLQVASEPCDMCGTELTILRVAIGDHRVCTKCFFEKLGSPWAATYRASEVQAQALVRAKVEQIREAARLRQHRERRVEA
jgi:hypothetical protein